MRLSDAERNAGLCVLKKESVPRLPRAEDAISSSLPRLKEALPNYSADRERHFSPAPRHVTSHHDSPQRDTGRSSRNGGNMWQWIFNLCGSSLTYPEEEEHGYRPECKPCREEQS